MAYIEPGSLVRLIKWCPLSDTYENTARFDSAAAQQEYFTGLVHRDFEALSYERVESGEVMLEGEADDYIGHNYMMFQNTPFTGKWYYAFVTDVLYENNSTMVVKYKIDVIQTWMFDWTLHECFIDRQHDEQDALFGNLVPEDLDLGDSYRSVYQTTSDMNDMRLGILATCTIDGEPITSGDAKNNYYSGLNVIAGIPISDVSTVNSLVGSLVDSGDEDSIIAMFEYPSFMGDASQWYGSQDTYLQMALNVGSATYYPTNNKLHTYPYSYLLVSNNCGQTAVYHWEDFDLDEQRRVHFTTIGMMVPSPKAMCYPRNHRGIPSDFDSGLNYEDFPQLAWTGDAFKAWYAQNANQQQMTIANTISSGVITGMYAGLSVAGPAGVIPGAMAGAAGGAAQGTATALAKKSDLENTPAPAHGQVATNSLNTAAGKCQFSFYEMTIKEQFARIIDDYFTLYGYAQHKVAVPNLNARTRWTFVKTIGSDVSGPIPKKHLDEINSIFDSGVRFWNDPSEIGNYSLGNPPRG